MSDAPRFVWDDDEAPSHVEPAYIPPSVQGHSFGATPPSVNPATGEADGQSKFSQAFAMGNHLMGMLDDHNKGGKHKKGKKGKKSKKQTGIERQMEAIIVAGCTYLGIKLPPVVTRQVIKQIISQCQQFPQAQQLFALLEAHQVAEGSDGSDSDSGKKKHKKKSSSGSSDDSGKKKKKKKSSGSSGSDKHKHKSDKRKSDKRKSDKRKSDKRKSDKKSRRKSQEGPRIDHPELPWVGSHVQPGAYGGYPSQPLTPHYQPAPVYPQQYAAAPLGSYPSQGSHPFPDQAPAGPVSAGLFDTYAPPAPAGRGVGLEFPGQASTPGTEYPPVGY